MNFIRQCIRCGCDLFESFQKIDGGYACVQCPRYTVENTTSIAKDVMLFFEWANTYERKIKGLKKLKEKYPGRGFEKQLEELEKEQK